MSFYVEQCMSKELVSLMPLSFVVLVQSSTQGSLINHSVLLCEST